MRRRAAIVVGAVAAAAAAAVVVPSAIAGSSCRLPSFGPGRDYHPRVDPADFSPNVTNQYLPLTPGRVLVYAGTKDGKKALDLVVASSRTRVVDGVTTRVVEDRNYLGNVLAERTSDYYAQDRCGNVWYFGEDTAELDAHGRVVSTEGSWHAGVGGAQPGVIMPAHPQVGRRFRQEWYQGHAEDVFRVLDRSAPVAVPFGSLHALRTEETTALEPGVVDNKYYAKGIGEVAERSVKGPREEFRLVEVIS
jgi:hypothetical protein